MIGQIDLHCVPCCVTKLWNQIYVVLPSPSSIQVYDDQNPFTLQREIKITEIESPRDIESCESKRCLYITDYKNKCVWKLTTTDDWVTKWLEGIENPFTLSIYDDENVVISRNSELSSVEIYSPDASLIRRTRLPSDVSSLRHAVVRSNGNFVVAHLRRASESVYKWVVSEVNSDGQIIQNFNSDDRSQQLNVTSHLSLDSDDRVTIADYYNNRLIMLDSDLKWINVIQLDREKKDHRIHSPWRLFHDRKKNEILVCSNQTKRVLFYKL